jgi:hypothetical protein
MLSAISIVVLLGLVAKLAAMGYAIIECEREMMLEEGIELIEDYELSPAPPQITCGASPIS